MLKKEIRLKLTFSQGVNASAISRRVAKYLKNNSSAATQGTYEYLDMEKALKQFSSQMSIITTSLVLLRRFLFSLPELG